jgi:hypothetical protein
LEIIILLGQAEEYSKEMHNVNGYLKVKIRAQFSEINVNDNISIWSDVIALFWRSHVNQVRADNLALALLTVLTGWGASLANIFRLVQIERSGSVGRVIFNKCHLSSLEDQWTPLLKEFFDPLKHIIHDCSHCLRQLCLVFGVRNHWNIGRIIKSYIFFRGGSWR